MIVIFFLLQLAGIAGILVQASKGTVAGVRLAARWTILWGAVGILAAIGVMLVGGPAHMGFLMFMSVAMAGFAKLLQHGAIPTATHNERHDTT